MATVRLSIDERGSVMAKAAYRLVRTTPGGVEKSQGPVDSVRRATVLAAYVLYDNANVSRSEAQGFSVRLGNASLGETVAHEGTGYRFRVERA